jgi:cytochrome c peroxidase
MANTARLRWSGLTIGAFSAVAALAAPAVPVPRWPTLARYERMAVPADNALTPAKVALGRQLFFDPRMSGNGSASCTSCHQPAHALADPRPRSVRASGKPVGRSCPTLWNVGYQQAFFWEGSGASLEQAVSGMWSFNLAAGPATGGGTADVVARLAAVPGYARQFADVFGAPPDETSIARAIAAWLRTLVAERSAWNRYQLGDRRALPARARRGLAVFEGKAGCASCHNGQLLTDLQFHNVGIGGGEGGRFDITHVERDHGAFKTPTLLNVGRTAPYFHDGSVATLEQAVDLMARGGIANPHRDPALVPRTLGSGDRADLLAFLRALTVDTDAAPPSLPQ